MIASIKDHSPELVLVIGGLLAIFIVYLYLKDEGSTTYKFAVFLGLVAGVAACWVKATHRPVVWFVIGLVAAGTTLALGALSLVARWMDSSSSGM